MDRYGEAIFATRPWTRFAGATGDGIRIALPESLPALDARAFAIEIAAE